MKAAAVFALINSNGPVAGAVFEPGLRFDQNILRHLLTRIHPFATDTSFHNKPVDQRKQILCPTLKTGEKKASKPQAPVFFSGFFPRRTLFHKKTLPKSSDDANLRTQNNNDEDCGNPYKEGRNEDQIF